MGNLTIRPKLVEVINRAFAAENIAETLRRLTPLRPGADFLDICDQLGLLQEAGVYRTNLRAYRRDLTVPVLNRRISTVAIRAALLNRPNPIPLEISIEDGEAEAIAVTTRPDLISIAMTRIPPPVKPSP